MKKRFIALLISALLVFSMSMPAAYVAADEDNDGTFYGELSALLKSQDDSIYFGSLSLDVSEINDAIGVGASPDAGDDPLLAAINTIAAAAGATVTDENGTVVFTGRSGETIEYDNGYIVIDDNAVVGDGSVPEDDIAYYLTTVSEALDLAVDWNDDATEATVSAPYQTARILAYADTLDSDSFNVEKVLHSGNFWVLQFRTPGEAKAACLELETRGITASPDHYVPADEPLESEDASGEGMTSIMSTYNSWGVENCKFPEFVNQYSSRMSGRGVVAVIDSGVDAAHPFLSGRVLDGYDFVDDDGNASDGYGHGTHVAGTIIDCSGAAPVSILPVRVMDNTGCGYGSTIITGIKYAAEQGADVINLSLGGSRGKSTVMEQTIKDAISAGTLVVVSAGNESTDTKLTQPAYITAAGNVVVSAGDSSHTRAYFSNYGQSVDIMAPGVNIKSCIPGNQYDSWAGTSMAAPHVAAAAILLDLTTGKSLSPADLENLVRSASTDGNWKDQYKGYGFLDMSKAKVPSQTTPAPDPELPFIDKDEIQYPEAVKTLVSLGVISGFEDGSFRPKDTLTRAQACRILVALYDLQSGSGGVKFDDVSGHWAESYIQCCASLDIVAGYGNGKFGPNDPLTGDAWAKMLLIAMGYNAEANGIIGTDWAVGVGNLADEVNLNDGISDSYDSAKPITREQACLLAYNSISD